MIACTHCRHLTLSHRRCDHCGAAPDSGRSRAAAAALLGLSLTGCPLPESQADYGVPDTGFVDADDDGFTPRDGDCDDADPDIHPDAPETVGDGVDSNCDGDDDT